MLNKKGIKSKNKKIHQNNFLVSSLQPAGLKFLKPTPMLFTRPRAQLLGLGIAVVISSVLFKAEVGSMHYSGCYSKEHKHKFVAKHKLYIVSS